MLKCIVICGGGGKSTLYQEYPDIFLDIDHFMWNNTTIETKNKLLEYIAKEDFNNIGRLYKITMTQNKELRKDKRIILVHHPINAEWLDRTILLITRPTLELHKNNIKDRNVFHQNLSMNDWNTLTYYEPVEYSNFDIFNTLIFDTINF